MEQIILPESWQEWEIIEKIGSGAFGTVYKARRVVRKQEFFSAIKIIRVPSEESEIEEIRRQMDGEQSVKAYFNDMVDGYIREINTMDELKGNSNIVSVEDYCVIEDSDKIGWTIYIRMEYLQSFAKYASAADITEEEVIKLGIDICSALQCCEQLNIVHRDIKPDNVFIAPLGQYKLGDFGEAKQLGRTLSSNSSRGTFGYMAPEVYNGKEYGLQADIYSLGIMLYRLMNHNREPFVNPYKQLITYNEREEALRRRMAGEKLPPPESTSESLAKIILKACSYVPNERYRNATEMKQDLLSLQGYQGQVTSSETQNHQGQFQDQSEIRKGKNSQRNNMKIGIALLAVFLVIAIIVLIVSVNRRQGNEKKEEELALLETEIKVEAEAEIENETESKAKEDTNLTPEVSETFAAEYTEVQGDIRENDYGDTFKGVFDEDGYLDGWGVCEYSNGDIFEGNYSHGYFEGYGLWSEIENGHISALKYFRDSGDSSFNYGITYYPNEFYTCFAQNYYDDLNERWAVSIYEDSDCLYCVECIVPDGSVGGERDKMYFYYYADGTYDLYFLDENRYPMDNEEMTTVMENGVLRIGYYDDPDSGDGIWFYDYGNRYEFCATINGAISTSAVIVMENGHIVLGNMDNSNMNGDAIEYTGDGYIFGECVNGSFEGEALYCDFVNNLFYKDEYRSDELVESELLSFPNGISDESEMK